MTENSVIGRGGMDHVSAPRSRHVTAGTIIIPALLEPDLNGEAATPIGVALQATLTVIAYLLLGCG
jgi:hypothetical protein